MTPDLSRAVSLARLTLLFSRVERVTRHEDGVRPETDSDHTVMLGLIACDFADPDVVNVGLVAQFALVHDIVEAYAGDVQTLTISEKGRADKQARELAASARLRAEFGAESWLYRCLVKYDMQDTDEARYVRVLDKVLPKLTHLLNGCVAARLLVTPDGFVRAHLSQYEELRSRYPQSFLNRAFALLAEAMIGAEQAWGATE